MLSITVLITSLLGTASALKNGVGKLPKMGYDSMVVTFPLQLRRTKKI